MKYYPLVYFINIINNLLSFTNIVKKYYISYNDEKIFINFNKKLKF